MANQNRAIARDRRHARIRRRVQGTAARPRLNVFRSLEHIYAQLIDDESGHTLISASTIDPETRVRAEGLTKIAQAKLVGEVVAERALAAGIKNVVFDRGGYLYHGRIKALADGSRDKGLNF